MYRDNFYEHNTVCNKCVWLYDMLLQFLYDTRNCCRYDPESNQRSCDIAPTSSCRTSVGVAVLDGFLNAVGGQDGIQCLNHVQRLAAVTVSHFAVHSLKQDQFKLYFGCGHNFSCHIQWHSYIKMV